VRWFTEQAGREPACQRLINGKFGRLVCYDPLVAKLKTNPYKKGSGGLKSQKTGQSAARPGILFLYSTTIFAQFRFTNIKLH
jgi:hypothetical protein